MSCAGQMNADLIFPHVARCESLKRNILVDLDGLDRHVLIPAEGGSDVCAVGKLDNISGLRRAKISVVRLGREC
jgi:hypothetical protein